MAKKTNRQQPSIFKKDTPKMPEGYYSSGPNPNLEKFVEEHSTAYDPVTDEYKVLPFDKQIETTRSSSIFNMHTYWSKKPHDAIQEYIKHYTKTGDLVLDPFCGSGSTSLAALLEARKAIAIDLSPAATFITKNYCTPEDTDALQKAFNELETAVKNEMDWLYETRCDRCDGKAKTSYVIYSYIFECSRCLRKVPLFDCEKIEVPKNSGEGTKKINACPFCYSTGYIEEIKPGLSNRYSPIPVLVNYECLDGCKPKRAERKHNDKDTKKAHYFHYYDLEKINKINELNIPHWYPKQNFPTNFARWLSDLKNLNINYVNQMFTKRNLWALSLIIEEIRKLENVSDSLLFLLTSIIYKASKMMGHNSDGIGRIKKGTYYVPPVQHIINVWDFMRDSLSDFIMGYKSINQIKSNHLLISTDSATDIRLNENSIDYIFTDPPYSGTVQYGELNFLWEVWLNFETNWHNQEIVVNKPRNLTEDDWQFLMHYAMTQCFRILKPGRWISLCYHDTSEGTWQLIQDIMSEVGFISEDVEQTLFIETTAKTENQYFGKKVTKRDLVINFRKPRPGETQAELIFTGNEDKLSFQEKAKKVINEILESNPGSTVDKIYDQLVSRMVRKGEFERHDFIALLRSVAEEVQIPDEQGKVISRWYLLETTETVDEAESKKEEAAAKRLEAFMNKHIKEHPEFDGVHYSDLFEQYLPVKDKPRRLLIDWLPEYFYRTSEGTWRSAQDDEERQQKSALRSSGSLRRIKRFINAILNSVPPAEKDRPENAATLADWIYQCRRAGLFEQGKLLYEQGGLSFENLPEEAQLAIQEDYQICIRRARQAVLEKDIKNQKNKSQASLF